MIENLSYLTLKRTVTSWKSQGLILRPGVCSHASAYLQGCIELHQPHITHARGWWCFQSAHLAFHTALLLLRAYCLVSVLPFFTKKEPPTPTRYIPLLCSLAEDCNSMGCSFPSQGAFVSQPELGYFSVLGLECKCKACVYASSVTGLPVPGIWDFTCGPALRGCMLFAVCWQLYSLLPVVLLSVWFAFLGQQLFMSVPWFVFSPASLKSMHMLMVLCH